MANNVRWAVKDYLAGTVSALPDPTDRIDERQDFRAHDPEFDISAERTIFLSWLSEQKEPDLSIARRCWLNGAPSKEVAAAEWA